MRNCTGSTHIHVAIKYDAILVMIQIKFFGGQYLAKIAIFRQ